jgi:transposase
MQQGVIVSEQTIRTHELSRFFEKRERCIVVIESCAESRKVALMLRGFGHEVRVVPTAFVRSLGVGARRIKTDKRDARNLAEASFRMGDKLPSVHVRSDEISAIQDLLRGRTALIESRTASINFVRSWLRKELRARPRCEPETFCERVRAELKPEDDPHGVIAAHLATIEGLNDRIAELDKRIAHVAKQSEKAKRLQKISGVGPIVALAFSTAIDDPKRFASGSHVASYVGLSPGENTTGGQVRRTGIVAAGQKQLRSVLIQAAHSKMNARKSLDPMALWAHELARTKKRQVAICALARRLAVVMWAMLRDDAPYDPGKTRCRHPKPSTESMADDLVRALHAEASPSP